MTGPDMPDGGLSAEAPELWAVLEDIPARVSLIDGSRKHVYVNRQYAEFVGRPAPEIVGKTVAEIYGDDEDARLLPFAEAALAGEVVRWEGWVKAPDGGDRFIERVYKPYRGDASVVRGFFVLVRDTTAHQLAEREQRRLHRMLGDAIESLPSGFVVYDSDHRIALCNAAFAEPMGASPKELLGAGPREVLRRVAGKIRAYDGHPFEGEEAWATGWHWDRFG